MAASATITLLFSVLVSSVANAGAATIEEGRALKRDQKIAEAEAVFRQVVDAQPTDAAALSEWATVLGWLGRHDESIAAWKRALAQTPEDPDAAMGLARVQYWKGELPAARTGLQGLLARAPDNVDALTLAGDVQIASGDRGGAHDLYLRAARLAPSPELDKKLAGTRGPLTRRFDAGGQVDGYDTRSTEGSFFAQGSWQAVPSLVLSAGYEQLHQFGEVDHRVNAGFYLSPINRVLLNTRLAVTPTADTVAPWDLTAGADIRIARPVTGLLSVRHLDFSNQGVTIMGAGLRIDSGRWSLSGQGGLVTSTIADLAGYGTLRVELAVTEPLHVYAAFARGEQTQLLLPSATATTFGGGVTWQLEEHWGARLDYTHEVYGDAYIKNSVGSAITYKF